MFPPHSNEPNRVSTGVPGLDRVLNGGLPRNRLYLIEGAPGTGKTTLAINFLLEGKNQGQRGLYISLSESKEELESVAASHGWDITGIDLYEMDAAEGRFSPEEQYTLLHPDEVELAETTKHVFELVEKVKPDRVVFDSLSEMRLLARDPLRYRRQILSLKHFFAGRKITILLLDDLTSGPNDLQLQSIAHGVIQLNRLGQEYGVSRRFLNVVKLRGAEFQDGSHDYAIRRGGLEVFPRLVAADFRNKRARQMVSSGVKELDNLLGGGLGRGASTLVLGPAGSGKSNLVTQYVHSILKQGEAVRCYVFEESQERLLSRAHSVGLDLTEFLASGQLRIRQLDPAEISPGEFGSTLQTEVEKNDVSTIVIDSLSGYVNAMPNERFLLIQMHELLSYLNNRGVLTLLTLAQHGLLGQMSSPVDLSYLADTLLLLRYFETKGEVRQAISVIKKREGSHERTIREFKITSEGIRVGHALTKLSRRINGNSTLRRDKRAASK